nr:ribonuclease H-like domain-containing protein [Tanacetum cinerariifolium]
LPTAYAQAHHQAPSYPQAHCVQPLYATPQPNPNSRLLGPAPGYYPTQATMLPSAFSTMTLQDPTWNMDTGFVDPRYPHHVCLLRKSLYGLKKAPRASFQQFAGYATRVGFYHSRCDSSLFILHEGSQVVYLLIHVDDIILTASSTYLLQQVITSLHNEFDMTDPGTLNYFLGNFATRHSTGLFLSQKQYAIELLARVLVQDPTLYRSLAGGLQYLTFTRPDISYAIQQICLYMHDPREPHLAAVKRILRYIRGTLFFWETTSCLGLLSASRLSLVPVLMLNTRVLPMS